MQYRLVFIYLFLALPTVGWAQTYEQLKSQATTLLVQHEADKANNVKIAWDERDKAAQAGDVWLGAAKVAKDDLQRFEAYDQAGHAYGLSSALRKNDVDAYRGARDIISIPGGERARVSLELAKLTRSPDDYRFVLGIAGGSPQVRAAAYHALSTTYGFEARNDPKLYEQAVEYKFSEVQELLKFDPKRADSEIGMAMVTATKIPDRQKAVTLLERLHKVGATLVGPDSKALGLALHDLELANRLISVKAEDKALAIWKRLGSSNDCPANQREEAWLKAAELYKARKQVEPALDALQEASKHRTDNFVFSEKIARQRIDLYDEAKRPQDSLTVLVKLIAHPKIVFHQKEKLIPEQARRLYALGKPQEALAVLKKLESSPEADDGTALLVCKEQMQLLLKSKDLAAARKLLDSTKLRLSREEVTKEMLLLSGELYQFEKKYLQAHSEYQQASQASDRVCRPSGRVVVFVMRNFREAVREGQLEPAKQMLEDISTRWVVNPIVTDVLNARYCVATQQITRAQTSLANARQRLLGLPQSERNLIQKEIDEISSTLPK